MTASAWPDKICRRQSTKEPSGSSRDATTTALSAAYATNRPSRVAEREALVSHEAPITVRSVATSSIATFPVLFAETPDRGNETTELRARNASVFESGSESGSDARAYEERVVRESTRVAPSRDSSCVVSNVLEIFPESRRDPDALRTSPDLETRASASGTAFSFVSVFSFSFVIPRIPEDAFDAASERAPAAPAARSSRGAKPSSSNAGYSSTGPASSQVTTASGLVDARVSEGALSSSNGSDAT